METHEFNEYNWHNRRVETYIVVENFREHFRCIFVCVVCVWMFALCFCVNCHPNKYTHFNIDWRQALSSAFFPLDVHQFPSHCWPISADYVAKWHSYRIFYFKYVDLNLSFNVENSPNEGGIFSVVSHAIARNCAFFCILFTFHLPLFIFFGFCLSDFCWSQNIICTFVVLSFFKPEIRSESFLNERFINVKVMRF